MVFIFRSKLANPEAKTHQKRKQENSRKEKKNFQFQFYMQKKTTTKLFLKNKI